MTEAGLFHLRGGGTSLLVSVDLGATTRILWWGADLGDADLGALRQNAALLLPSYAEADPSRPAVAGHRVGADFSPLFKATGADFQDGRLVVNAADSAAGLELRSEIEIAPSGILRLRHFLRNSGDSPYVVDGLAASLPIPGDAGEVLDFTGRWIRERSPQRRALGVGAIVRDSRRGRTGHDATTLMCAGTPGFGFRYGQVWAVHTAWSGNHSTYAEREPSGVGRLGGGELLLSGEVVLAPGEEYASPWLYAAYSGSGLDGISTAFHRWMRSRPQHPRSPRPVVLNTWEAVYFRHDLETLKRLADTAAEIGVERFVLDDGWFGKRRDDHAGLGDWYVSDDVWPDGLLPLIDYVRGLGMQFGLWFEPEMINPDSDLARAHPDWIMRAGDRLPPEWRQQQVLDIGNPAAYAHIFQRLDALLTEYPISFIKWDHNRDLVDAGRSDGNAAGVHRQTLAIYRLLDELRAKHPEVEIESCSSGGARIDLEILQRTDRVWASDCNDALERQAIQRWTGLLLPPEMIGAHRADRVAHHRPGALAVFPRGHRDFRASGDGVGHRVDLGRGAGCPAVMGFFCEGTPGSVAQRRCRTRRLSRSGRLGAWCRCERQKLGALRVRADGVNGLRAAAAGDLARVGRRPYLSGEGRLSGRKTRRRTPVSAHLAGCRRARAAGPRTGCRRRRPADPAPRTGPPPGGHPALSRASQCVVRPAVT